MRFFSHSVYENTFQLRRVIFMAVKSISLFLSILSNNQIFITRHPLLDSIFLVIKITIRFVHKKVIELLKKIYILEYLHFQFPQEISYRLGTPFTR